MLSASFILVSLAAAAFGTPLTRNLQVHESRDTVPTGFALTGPASADTTLKLRIALAQSNPDGLIDALYDVSTPSSAHYRQHLAKEEVEQYVAPSADTVSAINSWLKENDIDAATISPAGDWLGFSIPVSKASELFDAEFSVFTHNATGTEVIRTMQYSIPAELKGHLELVHPTISFPNPYAGKVNVVSTGSKPSNLTADAACDNSFTPACIQSLYGIPTTKAPGSGSQIGVSGFIGQYANKNDLQDFLQKYRPDISSSTTFSLETLDGGSDPQIGALAGDEANLDIQYTVGLATGVPVTFISVGNDYQDGALEGFLDIINYLLDQDSPPQVLTTSYGSDETSVSKALATQLCNAYAQLGARGVSILFATGDYGVAGNGGVCVNFVPTFPSGCPYITTVGATQNTSPEVAASFSAGGFSNYFDAPSYQTSAVSSYLRTLGNTDSGKFNTGGRAYPDVAAAGVAFNIIVDGKVEQVEGTSCASPTFASVIGLLNAELISKGQSPLGFLNPWLYGDAADALNDITSGDNPGCFTNGFPAAKGWDPVTGLGSPNYAKLLAAAS